MKKGMSHLMALLLIVGACATMVQAGGCKGCDKSCTTKSCTNCKSCSCGCQN